MFLGLGNITGVPAPTKLGLKSGENFVGTHLKMVSRRYICGLRDGGKGELEWLVFLLMHRERG